MNAIRCASKFSIAARRFFSDVPVVKILNEQTAKTVTAAAIVTEKPVETPKPADAKPKNENEAPKKKRSTIKPFLYGCVFTMIAGYLFVYQQIWKSSHQMEQSLADISVDISENVDTLEQKVARLESQINELKKA